MKFKLETWRRKQELPDVFGEDHSSSCELSIYDYILLQICFIFILVFVLMDGHRQSQMVVDHEMNTLGEIP